MRIMAFCRLPRNGEHTKAGAFRREFVCHTLPAVRGKGFSFPVKDSPSGGSEYRPSAELAEEPVNLEEVKSIAE